MEHNTDVSQLAPILLGLQIAAFGWRLTREIAVGDEVRRTWLPISDYFNLGAFFAVFVTFAIFPAANIDVAGIGTIVFGIASILTVMHPINTASHYRLWYGGREKYYNTEKYNDIPRLTDQEIASLILTILFTFMFLLYVLI